jgi:type II secretory pathway component PulF
MLDLLEFRAIAILAFVAVILVAIEVGRFLVIGVRRHFFGVLLLEHFAALVRLKLPLQDFAGACRDDVSNPSRLDMSEVEIGLREGRLLGDALGRVPLPREGWHTSVQQIESLLPGYGTRLVTPAEAEVLRVGETSGNLDAALRLVLDERRTNSGLMATLYASLLYPLAVLVIMSGLLLGLSVFIVPKWKAMYDELGVNLPAMSEVCFRFFKGIPTYFVLLVLTGPFFLLLWAARRRLREMHPTEDGETDGVRRTLLAVPHFLHIGTKQRLAEFCRELAMLLRVGTPAHRALRAIARGTMNPWFRDRVAHAQALCEKGVPLSQALEQARLDRRAAWYARAEGSPREIAEGLLQVAEEYGGKHRLALAVIKELTGPIVILLLGILVGFTFVSLFLPIIKLMNSLGG